MKKKHLEMLCCPKCGGSLDLTGEKYSADEIESGGFVCRKCNKYYEIKDRIAMLKAEKIIKTG